MGLGQLVSSLLAINNDTPKTSGSKRISLIRRYPRSDAKKPAISQTTTVSEPESGASAIIIDTRMHFAMTVSRNIERCVFKILNENGSVEPFKEYYRARDNRYYTDSEIQEIAQSKDHRDVVRYLVDEACGEAYVFAEKNNAGRLRVYVQFRRNEDDAVGQYSSDIPYSTDITGMYKAGEVTFGRIKRD